MDQNQNPAFHADRKWWILFSCIQVLVIISKTQQQFAVSADSTPLISSDLESSSLVSLSRLSGLVLQSINCAWRKWLAVQSRSCLVTRRCCRVCSAACPKAFCAAAVLLSLPAHSLVPNCHISPSLRRHRTKASSERQLSGITHLITSSRQP